MTKTIRSTDGTFSFPEDEVYGIPTVRILHHFEVVARTLDTPRHIRETCKHLGISGSVIVADTNGQCRTVSL